MAKGRLLHQPGRVPAEAGEVEGKSTPQGESIGQARGSWAGQLGQGSGSPGQLCVGEGEEKHSLLPVCVPNAFHAALALFLMTTHTSVFQPRQPRLREWR